MQARAVMTRRVQILMGNKLATVLQFVFVFLYVSIDLYHSSPCYALLVHLCFKASLLALFS